MSSAFERDGFVALDGFLDDGELPAARREVEAILAAPLPAGCERPHNTLAPLRHDDALVEMVLTSATRRGRIADALAADDLRWISGYVSVKEPRSGALWWHQDWWCWDHPVTYLRSAPQVALLCYLADTDARTGALRVLPGSHCRGLGLHAALPEAHAGPPDPDHVAMRDHDSQVTLAARAGDAVLLDYRLLHGTHPHHGERRRAALLLTFTPSWRSLPTEIRSHLIRHPALPDPEESPPAGAWQTQLLPRFEGLPRDLPLSRIPPARFAVRG